jgi:hypothetical protein
MPTRTGVGPVIVGSAPAALDAQVSGHVTKSEETSAAVQRLLTFEGSKRAGIAPSEEMNEPFAGSAAQKNSGHMCTCFAHSRCQLSRGCHRERPAAAAFTAAITIHGFRRRC